MILPVTDIQRQGGSDTKTPSQENIPSGQTSKQTTLDHESRRETPQEEGKHLFTVKPGGIAGYLCEDVSKLLLFGPFADPSSIIM